MANPTEEREQIALTVGMYTGWQNWSSGRAYDSLSGHTLAIGGNNKQVIGCYIACKHCNICEK
eukprot:scaffold49570_cov36-Attheya_sp.AAC.1